MTFDLDQRTGGWPEELRVLLKQYPRETWKSSASPMAQFWLEKHDAFRRQCDALTSITDDYRAERVPAHEFAVWVAPRLQNFLAHLHGHHQIEDHHYFPSFRAAQPRLKVGFETLEKDHETLHAGIADVIESVNAFIMTVREPNGSNADAQRHAGERYAESSLLLYRRLARHLEDEEDLIIPVMLDYG